MILTGKVLAVYFALLVMVQYLHVIATGGLSLGSLHLERPGSAMGWDGQSCQNLCMLIGLFVDYIQSVTIADL
jgi:hypothetical protein